MNIFKINPEWSSHSHNSQHVRHKLWFAHMPKVDVVEISESSYYRKAIAISIKSPGIVDAMEIHHEVLDENATISDAKCRVEVLCKFFYGDECFSPSKVP